MVKCIVVQLTRPSTIRGGGLLGEVFRSRIGTVGVAGMARPRSLMAWYMDSGCRWAGRSWRRPATTMDSLVTQLNYQIFN